MYGKGQTQGRQIINKKQSDNFSKKAITVDFNKKPCKLSNILNFTPLIWLMGEAFVSNYWGGVRYWKPPPTPGYMGGGELNSAPQGLILRYHV